MSAAATGTWDANAGRYGRQDGLEAAAVAAALRVADPGTGDRVVDLATGTGLVLRALARRGASPRQAVGVDRSPGMLHRVGELPPDWSVVCADARQVPLPTGGADLVTCAYLLQLLTAGERAEVLAEARRLMAPGARLVLVTPWCDRRRVGGRIACRGMAMVARARPATWGGLHPVDPTADLQAAGFAVTHRVQLPRGGYPSLVLGARVA